jgi:hypothetical protein
MVLSMIEQLFGNRTATIIEDAITPAEAAAIRLDGWRRYTLLDRGSYDFIDDIAVPASLARFGTITSARALRLVPGDYLLAHHDELHDDLPLELVLDLSPAPVAAEIHYRRRGSVFFRVPCAPRSLSVVERGPTVTRNHTYVSKRYAGAVVIRIVMLVRSAS